jgi:patatin-like phospholipase/acyl hydrolase
MVVGTSTGGLLALAVTAPDPERPERPRLSGEELAHLYVTDGPRIFGDRLQRLRSLWGWIGPKHSPAGLEEALRTRLGDARLRDALREVLITSYDMREPGPHFFKRWRARQSGDRDASMIDVGLATAAAPTYFPSHGIGEQALVDGGVFAANPAVAGVVEALKRRDEQPASLSPEELLVVSLGTGQHEIGQKQSEVRGWGRIGWIWPRRGTPALLSTFLDGQSDAAHHWAEILLNHEPGKAVIAPARMGEGPRYWRFQASLERSRGLDDAGPASLAELDGAADRLIAERAAELERLAERLARLDPLPPDPA